MASTSATRLCVTGEIGSANSLRLRFAISASEDSAADGSGIWDEMFVKINGQTLYLWRAVDHEGEVLEAYVTKSRDRYAALRFLRKTMKSYGHPEAIVTDRLRSYVAALKILGMEHRHHTGRWLNNRIENSHQPMRRRERAMHRFRAPRTLRNFVTVHSSLYNHFNLERHLYRPNIFKQRRCSALAEWRLLCSA